MAMPLVLNRNPQTDGAERLLVYSGKAVVGTLMRAVGGEKQNWWHWSITGFYISPLELGPASGMVETREQAMKEFATRWRTWLD